ncbi:MAG: hypothetical protein WCG20_01605 [bacterium]
MKSPSIQISKTDAVIILPGNGIDIFTTIKNLNFQSNQYIIVGSSPMAAHAIRNVDDIDIVVTPTLFETCKQQGWEQIPWTYSDKLGQVYLRRGSVELYLDVNCGNITPSFEDLLERSEVIDTVRFASLTDILKFKQAYNKPKHLVDVALIQEHLKNLGIANF